MQRGLDLLCRDYAKEGNKRERGHSFGVGATVQQKKMALRRMAVAFSRHPRIEHCSARINGHSVSLAKAVWLRKLKWALLLESVI